VERAGPHQIESSKDRTAIQLGLRRDKDITYRLLATQEWMDMLPSTRILDALVREETRRLNLHLPRGRKTLEQLLREETPSVRAIDGSEIILDKRILEKLARLTPSSIHRSIHLPIVVLRRLDLGKSVFTVLGDNVEQFTARKILGLTDRGFEQASDNRETTYLYKPHVAELVREFHSLVVIGFGPRDEESSFFSQS